MEFMLTKTPWIASDNVAYNEFKDAGYGKIIENSVDSWTNSLLNMVDNLEEENNKMLGKSFDFAKSQDVYLHAEDIANTYRLIAKEQAKMNLYDDGEVKKTPKVKVKPIIPEISTDTGS